MTRYNPFKITKSNNRKETKGRAVRKQYVPLYTTNEKEREKLGGRSSILRDRTSSPPEENDTP